MRSFLILSLSAALLTAEPLKLLVIGDSQSEEYAFELPFTAPDFNPVAANVQNWVEILASQRSDQVDFGNYESRFFSYPDIRNAGFSRNWGVPGAETSTWKNIITATLFENQEFLSSRVNFTTQLSEVDAIVIILGGNDANGDYRALQNNQPPVGWQGEIVSNLRTIIDFIQAATINPIYLANIPDVGVTQLVQNKFPDPARRQVATQLIENANDAIAQLAQEKGATLIDFFSLTERISPTEAIRIGEIQFFPAGHPNNKPRYLLWNDGFHPATATQALLANLILEALDLQPLPDEVILSELLEIPPNADAEYLSWVSGRPGNNSFFADPDGNGFSNLGDYALEQSRVHIQEGAFSFQPDANRSDYVIIWPEVSNDLSNWSRENCLTPDADGIAEVITSAPFFRLDFEIR